MGIQHTCQKLNARLALYGQKYCPDARLKTLAHAAYHDQGNLTANRFYKTPKSSTNGAIIWTPYQYTGTSSGRHYPQCRARRTHRLSHHPPYRHKNGRRPLLNPAIDYGQIEGAFVQGQALFMMEETLWQQNGQLFTRGPGTYKISGFGDIPQVFNVGLLKGVKWAKLRSIQSFKGIGEPPLFLGASVLFALREAVKAARESVAVNAQAMGVVELDSPATAERLRAAVGDRIVLWAMVEALEGEKGFFVEATA